MIGLAVTVFCIIDAIRLCFMGEFLGAAVMLLPPIR